MDAGNTQRPRLKIRRINLDIGRENVVVISRRSRALRPDVFRGFSRVELRVGTKVLLATLLLTDDGLVGTDEIGLPDPAFRRFAEPAGGLVVVTPATAPDSLDSVRSNGPELARWIASLRPIRRGAFLVHGEPPALTELSERIAERTVPAVQVFVPILDDIYELTTTAPEAVVNLDWHNEMSKLILDINETMEAAADDRARGVIVRRLRRALEAQNESERRPNPPRG